LRTVVAELQNITVPSGALNVGAGPTAAILFARAPVAGRTKTRLQTHLTPAQAAALYEAFLQDTTRRLRDCGASRRVVAAADEEAVSPLRDLLDAAAAGVEITVQRGEGLGERMAAAFDEAFTAGAGRAVLMGTDSPSLPAATIDDALRRLQDHDVVLGPVVDGGYYLVGLRRDAAQRATGALFGEGLAWSTGRVLEESVERLPDELRLALLPPWYDVDHPHEAAFLRTHLEALARAGHDVAPCSRRALRGLDLPPPE
jgi:rSAM/selenodomain-associated transferase 1